MSAGRAACAACGSPSVFRCSRCASRLSPARAPPGPRAPSPRSSDVHPPVAALPESAGKATKYCSRACQRADWPTHRRTCAPPRESPGDTVQPSTVASPRALARVARCRSPTDPGRTTPRAVPPRRRPPRPPPPPPSIDPSATRARARAESVPSPDVPEARRSARGIRNVVAAFREEPPPARARTRRATRPTFPAREARHPSPRDDDANRHRREPGREPSRYEPSRHHRRRRRGRPRRSPTRILPVTVGGPRRDASPRRQPREDPATPGARFEPGSFPGPLAV